MSEILGQLSCLVPGPLDLFLHAPKATHITEPRRNKEKSTGPLELKVEGWRVQGKDGQEAPTASCSNGTGSITVLWPAFSFKMMAISTSVSFLPLQSLLCSKPPLVPHGTLHPLEHTLEGLMLKLKL